MKHDKALFSLNNMSFAYDTEIGNVLENVSFDVYPGDFVVVCGISGCGKTTLLNHLKPAMLPKGTLSGSIEYKGVNIFELDDVAQAEQIGYVFQDPDAGIVTDKVWHELAFGMEGLSYTKTEIRKRVAEMSSFFGIRDIFHSRTDKLSGGQKQLVNLAAVMILRPQVIILDEPVSQLDPISASEFISMLGRINREFGTTVIISEHRLEELFELCNKVLVIDKKHMDFYGSFRDFSEYIKGTDDALKEMMTVPMRIFLNAGGEGNMPLSVAEGRTWLQTDGRLKFIRGNISDEQLTEKNKKKNNYENLKKVKPMLKAEDVWFRYDRSDTDVLRSLYMNIYEGKIHAIVGENGAGKSTLLSILSGILSPDRGKIKNLSDHSVSLLPQRAELLFSENTVAKELNKCSSCPEEKRQEIINMCKLEELLSFNPYDLSGGERQRLALAIVLTQDTDIILLDEPTKGMDSSYKKILGGIMSSLADDGKTIIVVSHDIEFCAMYTQVCYMMFDGEITAGDYTKKFFLDNTFYTTAAVRMTRDIIDGCVVVDDVTGVDDKSGSDDDDDSFFSGGENGSVDGNIPGSDENVYSKEKSAKEDLLRKNSKTTKNKMLVYIVSILIYIVAIPLTVYAGSVFFNNSRYYFISLLVIAEAFVPFLFTYEVYRPGARRVAIIAVMSAIAVVSRVAFYMLPAVKPIIAVVIISGAALGALDGFMIGSLSILASNVLFGQGPWTPWQMIGMGMTGLVAGLLFFRKREHINVILLCIAGFIETVLIYGVSVNVGTVFTMSEYVKSSSILKTCIAGIPFDLILAATTAAVLAFAARPFINKLNRVC